MKNVPIKFRGVYVEDVDEGGKIKEFVYGDLVHSEDGTCYIKYFIDDYECEDPVNPDSVCQLIGYDADGKEIYEGDDLIESDVTTDYKKEFTNRLRQARQRAGLTQKELAEKIGRTQNGYTLIENGRRGINTVGLIKLIKVLNVSADWLLGNGKEIYEGDSNG